MQLLKNRTADIAVEVADAFSQISLIIMDSKLTYYLRDTKRLINISGSH